MKPEIIQNGEFIEVIGHYDDEVQCAKMTLLAELYAVEHRDGYAKFKLDDANKLGLVNERLEFVPINIIYGLGLSQSIYLWYSEISESGYSFASDFGDIGTLSIENYVTAAYSDDYFWKLSSSQSELIPPVGIVITGGQDDQGNIITVIDGNTFSGFLRNGRPFRLVLQESTSRLSQVGLDCLMAVTLSQSRQKQRAIETARQARL